MEQATRTSRLDAHASPATTREARQAHVSTGSRRFVPAPIAAVLVRCEKPRSARCVPRGDIARNSLADKEASTLHRPATRPAVRELTEAPASHRPLAIATESVCQVVAWHHQPTRAYEVGGAVGLMVALLRVAEELEYTMRHTDGIDEMHRAPSWSTTRTRAWQPVVARNATVPDHVDGARVRKQQPESRSPTHFAVHLDLPAELGDDGGADVQAQTRAHANRLRREEGFEDAFEVLLGDAASGIGHFDDRAPVFRRAGDEPERAVVCPSLGQNQSLRRVHNHVQDDLTEAGFVRSHERHGAELPDHANAMSNLAPRHADGGVDDRTHVDGAGLALLRSRKELHRSEERRV